MTTQLIFVGERRSPTAIARGWRWEDGRLAGKQLFDALYALGIEPLHCRFANAFEVGHIDGVRRLVAQGWTAIGMGKKAQQRLRAERIPHRELTHPAARGSIRLKANYLNHVREVLS